jgi:hypothetical protein
MGRRLVDRVRVGPLGEETERFAADFLGQLFIDRHTDDAGSVLLTAEAEGAVYETTQHERRPLALSARIEECGDRGTARLEPEVMDGPNGFIRDHRGLIVHEAGC